MHRITQNATSRKPSTPEASVFVVAAIVIAALAISLDFASVDLMLPALESAFSLDLESVQWVINGYMLAFSVLMVAGGKFADAYGRKRVFLIGMAIFGLASLLGGAAWSGGSVVAFRVLQGVGAALLWPAMIGMACQALGEDRQAMALGLIFGTCSLGNAAGPVLGGALTQYFSWRWVLWVNVPMAIFAMLATFWKIPRDPARETSARNDYVGMGLLTFGLVALMLVVYQSDVWGWRSPKTIGLTVAVVGLLGAFPAWQNRSPDPLVPPDLLRNREIQVLCICVLLICQLFFVVLLYYTQFGMKFLGQDPVVAGARVVPFMLTYGVVSYFGGPICRWMGKLRVILFGLGSAFVASIILGFVGPGGAWVELYAGLILLGIGVGAVIPTVSARAIEVVGTDRAGLVSGITFMCQLSGAAVMLAINTAIFESVSARQISAFMQRESVTLTESQSAAVESVLRGAGSIHEIPATLASEVGDAAQLIQDAYTDGLRVVLWLSALLVLIALALTWRIGRGGDAAQSVDAPNGPTPETAPE